MSQILSVDDASFEAEVAQHALPALVDFWGDHCPACIQISPILAAVAAAYDGRVRVIKIHAAENPATSARYGIRAMPTILAFRGDQVVGQLVGARPKSDFTELADRLL